MVHAKRDRMTHWKSVIGDEELMDLQIPFGE